VTAPPAGLGPRTFLVENFSDAELLSSNCIRQWVLAKGRVTLEQSMMIELNKWTNGQRKVLA